MCIRCLLSYRRNVPRISLFITFLKLLTKLCSMEQFGSPKVSCNRHASVDFLTFWLQNDSKTWHNNVVFAIFIVILFYVFFFLDCLSLAACEIIVTCSTSLKSNNLLTFHIILWFFLTNIKQVKPVVLFVVQLHLIGQTWLPTQHSYNDVTAKISFPKMWATRTMRITKLDLIETEAWFPHLYSHSSRVSKLFSLPPQPP